ncbi:MAG: CARDB domain-containing protein [Myxococcota bacterium]
MQRFATLPIPLPQARGARWAVALVTALGASSLAAPAEAQTSIPNVVNFAAPYTDLQNIPGITGITTTSCSGSDDCLTGSISIPFNFTFLGQATAYNAFRISSNCWMTFDTTSSLFSDTTNDPIPSSFTPNNIIAFAWDDCRSQQMRYGVTGTSPNRIFVIESVYRYWNAGGSNAKNQIWLYEADNSFELRYADGTNLTSAYSASIGFEDAGGSAGYQLPCSPGCSNTQIAALDGRVIRAGDIPNPELTATFVSFPRGGFPSTTGTGTITVDNIGLSAATNLQTELWLSADDTLSPSTDFLIGTATTASAPNGSTTQAIDYTIPSGLPAGDYRLIANVDSNARFTEFDEGNNAVVADQRFATAYELAGSDCRVTNPGGVNPGDTLNFELDLVNNGVPFAGNVQVRLRASADASFDSTDTILNTVPMTFTGANTETGRASFTLSAGALTPGRYFPICEIDANNGVTETSESNNIVVGGTQFGSGPNFNVASVSFPAQIPPGSSQAVTTTLNNTGVPFNGTVQYRLYASVDATLDTTVDINLGLFDATFRGEAQILDTENVNFSASSVPGGRYRILAVLDPRSRVAEQDEADNQAVSAADFVNAIDFVARTAEVVGLTSSNVQAGDVLRVRGSAESVGLSFVGNVPVGVYFSADQEFDATDIAGYEGLIFFPGNTTGSIDVTFAVPSVPPGLFNILVVVNPPNTPAEADVTNNSARALTTVTVQGADLRAESLITPSVAFIGRTMEATLEIRNESAQAEARGFQYRYYLSENELIRVTDPDIFTSPTATIAAGGTQTFTDQLQIPSTFTSTQALYLGVIVDIFSAVPETSETNNIRRTQNPISFVFPIPDLEAQIVATATSAAAGEQLAVTRLISNTGVADATTFDYTYYLSSNPTITTDDTPLNTFQLNLPVNSDDYAIDVVDLPVSVSPGTYFIGLIVDPANTITEVSDTNNTAMGPALPVFGAAITFITDTLPNGTLGVPYETGLYARGGPLPIAWSVSRGSLPVGVNLDSQGGILSGTPTAEGLFEFTLRASSGTAFAERDFSVRITSPTVQLAISTQGLGSAIAGRPYSLNLSAVGGVPPYRWSTIGELPVVGMTLSEDGRLEGSPATPGQFPITFSVQDDLMNTTTTQLVLNVVSPGQSIQIQQTPLPNAVVGEAYCTDDNKVTFSASNGIEPYTWSVMGNLPMGMTFNEMGELCGTPQMAGAFDLQVRAQDSTALFDTALFRLTVQGNDDCAVATFTLPAALINTSYADTDGGPVKLTQVSCADPLAWSIVPGSGNLPPGLALAEDGTISGTPTAAGAFAFTAQVLDATQSLDLQPLSIIVEEPEPVIVEDDCTCATTSDRSMPWVWMALLPGLALVFRRRRR